MITTTALLNVALLAQAALAQNAIKLQHLGYTPAPMPGLNLLAASAGCKPGYEVCRTGCMPVGSVCCAVYVSCSRAALSEEISGLTSKL